MTDTLLPTLTSRQAVRAAGLFFDLLPGEQKPSLARLETIAEGLRDKAPADTPPAFEAIFAPANDEARGALARSVLARLAADETLAPHVNQAVALAAKPAMAIEPVSLIAILAVLTIAAAQIEGKDWKYTGGLPAVLRELHIDEIARQLPAVIKALPQSILEKFAA